LAADNRGKLCSPCERQQHTAAAVAPEMPPKFWERPALRAAFATTRFGPVLRAYHQERRGEVTQAQIAVWLGVSQMHVSRIIRGLCKVNNLEKLDRWTQALCIPQRYRWFKLSDQASEASAEQAAESSLPAPSPLASNQPEGTSAGPVRLSEDRCGGLPESLASDPVSAEEVDVSRLWARWDTVEIVSEFTRKDLMVDRRFTPNRREATRLVTGVAFGSALLEPLERWLAGRPDRPVVGRNGGIGLQEVEQIEHATRLFRSWDDQFGGGLRRKAVVGQLNEVADILRDSHPPAIAGRLFGAMAQLAETAATMSWDSGRQTLGQRYYVLALRASKSAGDHAFGANIMAGMARQLLYLDHPSDALELVRLAHDTSAGHVTATVQACSSHVVYLRSLGVRPTRPNLSLPSGYR